MLKQGQVPDPTARAGHTSVQDDKLHACGRGCGVCSNIWVSVLVDANPQDGDSREEAPGPASFTPCLPWCGWQSLTRPLAPNTPTRPAPDSDPPATDLGPRTQPQTSGLAPAHLFRASHPPTYFGPRTRPPTSGAPAERTCGRLDHDQPPLQVVLRVHYMDKVRGKEDTDEDFGDTGRVTALAQPAGRSVLNPHGRGQGRPRQPRFKQATDGLASVAWPRLQPRQGQPRPDACTSLCATAASQPRNTSRREARS
jgi:hypothetical protein